MFIGRVCNFRKLYSLRFAIRFVGYAPRFVVRYSLFITHCSLFIIHFTLSSCNDKAVTTKFVPYTGPVEEAENIQVLYSETAILKIKLETAKQIKYQTEDKIFPKPITIHFYDIKGSETAVLKSDSGRYDAMTKKYKVMGHVVVNQRATGQNMFTSELYWDPSNQKTYTDKPVTIEIISRGELINGLGLDANRDFSEMRMRQTSGFFNAPAGVLNQ